MAIFQVVLDAGLPIICVLHG